MSSIAKRIKDIIRANTAPSAASYFDSQRELFERKYAALVERKNAQAKVVQECNMKHAAWSQIISEKKRETSRYGQNYVSVRAKEAIAQLLKQAEESKALAAKECEMHQNTLDLIIEQLSKVETVLFRLRNLEYSQSIHQSLKEKALALNSPASVEGLKDAFNMQEFSRELQRVEYTTQALIELGAK